jgi:hypothetical protein
MKHLKWPSIEQYRSVIKNVASKVQFKGMSEEGLPIIDRTIKLPKLLFQGTEKLHGTNSGIVLDISSGEIWFQSRENIITPEKDNAGFAMFAYSKLNIFKELFKRFVEDHKHIADNSRYVAIYGEWAGKGVQKNVAIAEVPKFFSIFAVVFYDEDGHRTYLKGGDILIMMNSMNLGFSNNPEERIFNVWEFPTYVISIDFENPHIAQDAINKLVNQIESSSPVGKMMGVEGIGEGIVYRCINLGYEGSEFFFKVKGSKHSNTKVKTLASVDVEKINGINELVERLVSNERLEQMEQQVFNTLNGGEIDQKGIGNFIKAVMHDLLKEELDTISESGYTTKDISGPVSKICRNYILEKLKV